jgi:tetratricopeptide (TPR) repeat protein
MNRRERRAAGRTLPTKPAGPDPSTPAALVEAGLGHRRAGRHLDAQLCCQRALALQPGHADSLHLMGLLSLDAGQGDHALEWIAGAIRQTPRAEYLSSLGSALQQLGRHEEALKAFDKAIQLAPHDAGLWRSLGDVLLNLGRRAEALLGFQQVLTLTPRDWEAAWKSGILLHEAGRFEEALVQLNLCHELQPDHAPTLSVRAVALRGLKRFDAALADNRRAHQLDPGNAEICTNAADALISLGRHQEALPWLDRALALRPDFLPALQNKASSLAQLHRFEEAIAVRHLLKRLDPDDPEKDLRLGQLDLLTGNFATGWARREARFRIPGLPTASFNFAQPIWLGEQDVNDKTILVHADEGLGDTIQFVRYVPMLAQLGAQVILVVQDELHALLSGLPGVLQCLPRSAGSLPPFDMHCPICTLPLAFATRLETIPAAISYLPAPPQDRVQAWKNRLGPREKWRVGLVWSGNPKHANDQNRSLPFRTLSRICDLDIAWVSLQKDPRPDDRAALIERPGILDLTADLTDFIETAALISCLDLVITVDTSVAHLAGALGRPTWILLPYVPEWRWLLDREDSPWYPTVRLFRQRPTRDYAGVMDRVRAKLVTLMSKGPDRQ